MWRDHSDAVNRRLLRRWLPPGRVGAVLKTDLFDEASAEGLYPVLSQRAERVVGVDVWPAAVEAARRQHPDLEVHRADVRALPFPDASFDVVVSNSTLDHFDSFDDIPRALAELHRVLRPGGTLIVTMDNLVNPLVALRNALPFWPLQRLGVVPYFVGATCGPRRLRRVLAASRFRVDDMGAILHVPRAPAVAAAALVDRGGGGGARARLLRGLLAFERLGRVPGARYVSGYFVAARATRD